MRFTLAAAWLWYGYCVRDLKDVGITESVLEKDGAGLQKSDCKGDLWRPFGKWKKTGNWGKVFEVQKLRGNCGTIRSGSYVMKRGLDNEIDTQKTFKGEIAAMSAAKDNRCTGIIELEDGDPCVETEGTGKAKTCSAAKKSDLNDWMAVKPVGFVMPKKDGGTLKEWLMVDNFGGSKQPNFHLCAAGLLDQVQAALDCLHRAEYIHGDLKADNIFLSKVPNNPKTKAQKCPAQVWLADLGLSKKIGTVDKQWTGYSCSTHLPAGIFSDAPTNSDTLSIVDAQGNFEASAAIDLCSFRFMVGNLGASHLFEGLPANCGIMGARGTCKKD